MAQALWHSKRVRLMLCDTASVYSSCSGMHQVGVVRILLNTATGVRAYSGRQQMGFACTLQHMASGVACTLQNTASGWVYAVYVGDGLGSSGGGRVHTQEHCGCVCDFCTVVQPRAFSLPENTRVPDKSWIRKCTRPGIQLSLKHILRNTMSGCELLHRNSVRQHAWLACQRLSAGSGSY